MPNIAGHGRRLAILAASLCLGTMPVHPQNTNRGSLDAMDEAQAFVAGNVIYTLYHEIGHALVSDFDIPVLGREEDAVDNLATVMLLEDDSAVSDQAIIDAADAWFLLDADTTDAGEELPYFGAHGLDAQRGYQIICLAHGADPETFARIAADYDIPDDRLAECEEESAQTRDNWLTTLDDVSGWAKDERFGGRIIVDFEAPSNEQAALADALRDSGIVADTQARMNASLAFADDIALIFRDCDGDAGAWWDAEVREIVICYDLAQSFQDMIWQER